MDHGIPGKSLIQEVEKLREAVMLLCDLQKELATKVEAALSGSPINREPANVVPSQAV